MPFRVREILLVATEYDAFVLEEDGQLAELVIQEYRDLDVNPRHAPQVTRAASGADALQLLEKQRFDLVVTSAHLSDIDLRLFGRQVKDAHPGLAVGVLAAHAWELPALEGLRDRGSVDWIFLWQGDVKALFALVRQVEDRRNAEHDVLRGGVQAVLLAEDDARFASFLLPRLYSEMTRQTYRLMAEGLNVSHRHLRLRARPKILLAGNYEEAWHLYQEYAANVLGVISDIAFPRGGRADPEAGLALARAIRARDADVPILLQSTDTSTREHAESLPAAFLHKNAPNFLEELDRYIADSYGFGDFVFRLPDGTEVARASDLRELLPCIDRVPDASLEHHARHNRFSRWLSARTEFELAARMRPRRVSEFPSIADMRAYLHHTVAGYLRAMQRHVISDFNVERFDRFVSFARIGWGSLGGKGRGLAFLHKLLAQDRIGAPEIGVEVEIPQTVVLAADIFADYLEANRLHPRVLAPGALSDGEILDAFRKGRFSRTVRTQLARFLEVVTDPLAVRSSSILEDSLYQPFAGVYATVMLPNNHASLDVRLAQLIEAVKVVYASTYMKGARDYLEATPHRLEEEQMAVLLQRLVGSAVGTRFYPAFSGVAGSHNYYPFGPMKPADGVAQVAIGLGKSVVEGREALRFCPLHPQVLPQFSTVADTLRSAQRRFWALDLSRHDLVPGPNPDAVLVQLDTIESVRDGVADHLVSTHLAANDIVTTGLVPGGVPLATFAPVLRGQVFPLAELLVRVLGATEKAMGVPVEIEFAVDRVGSAQRTFNVLQVRPMLVERVGATAEEGAPDGKLVVIARRALGRGRKTDITDIVAVHPDSDRARTPEVAQAIERINHVLRQQGRTCVLIGPGRWGSRDPWLGIPVSWSQISAARVIVETDFADLEVEPSQGSHFFHNLTSFGIAYLCVARRSTEAFIDWSWLDAQPAVYEGVSGSVRHIRLAAPLRVVVDTAKGRGTIAAPSARDEKR